MAPASDPMSLAGSPGFLPALTQAVADGHDACITLLADLVRHPSLLGQEQSAQDLIAGVFTGLGLTVDRFPIDLDALRSMPGFSPAVTAPDGRDNVVGIYQPRVHSGRSLILNGHIDVVPTGPADLWSADPFDPVIRDGRMYGRGVGDMKAGIAAYIAAFAALRRMGYQPAAPVFFQSVVEEECTGNGALACLHRGYRADAAVIPEPFGQTLMTAQVGVMWLQIVVTGTPAHVLDTGAGRNAIESAYAIAWHLKPLEQAWNDRACPHRHAAFDGHNHPIHFNLGKIEGGEWASSVPTRCTLDMRIGFHPGQDPAAVRAAVEDTIAQALCTDPALNGVKAEVRYGGFQAEGFALPEDAEVLAELEASHHAVTGGIPRRVAMTCTTDARFFALYGDTPATCYGPHASRIHGIDESVDLASVQEVTAVLALFIARWCGLEPIVEQ